MIPRKWHRARGRLFMWTLAAWLGGFSGLFHASVAPAMEAHLSFDAIVQRADAIFLGKVIAMECRYGPKGKMIFTDISFEVDEVIYSREEVLPKMTPVIVLSFAGGHLGGEAVKVSDVPSFTLDSRYVLFTLIDGKTYASPVVGSCQGLFEVIADEATGALYPLAPGKRPILAVTAGNVIGGAPVTGIWAGVPEKARETVLTARIHAEPPVSVTGDGRAELAMPVQVPAGPGQAMTLDGFIAEIYRHIPLRKEGQP
jgi:hypothetical protein